MREIIDVAVKALQKYFITLSYLGYIKDEDVKKILVLLLLEELLNQWYPFVTENDYRIISRSLYKLFGSNCIIEFPDYIRYQTNLKSTDFENLRKSEDNLLRLSQMNIFRV